MSINRFTDPEHNDNINYVAMVDFMDYVTDPVELPVGLARVSARNIIVQKK